MKRQNESLKQKKTWSELTKEEQQAILECWHHPTSPELFMYIIGDLSLTTSLDFQGNLCIIGNVYFKDNSVCTTINGHFFVSGNIISTHFDVGDIHISGDFYVGGRINFYGNNINVINNFIVDGDVDIIDATVLGDFFVSGIIDCCSLRVCGIIDCYDIENNGHNIDAPDYICRCYQEEI